jgi:hypothetical protein
MSESTAARPGDEKFVSLTTFKRNGDTAASSVDVRSPVKSAGMRMCPMSARLSTPTTSRSRCPLRPITPNSRPRGTPNRCASYTHYPGQSR